MTDKIHVLLVEYDNKDHDNTIKMLQYFSYKVATVQLASIALSILSKGKAQFDLLLVNMNSPDPCGFQLLQDAIKMDLLVILMYDQDDATTTRRALEQGAFLCIKKPITMEITRYLWQYVLRKKASRLIEGEQFKDVIDQNMSQKEYGEEDFINKNAKEKCKSMKEVNSGSSQQNNVLFKRKVWTDWTEELHQKFMDAVIQLGEGRCYPKDILELMNIPGLTRMQVASHLQKCRNTNWLPPHERKSKGNEEMTPSRRKRPRAKVIFGSMPHLDNNSKLHLRFQDHEKNHQEFIMDPPIETNRFGDNHLGCSDKEYHPQILHDQSNYPFAQDNETFNMGQLRQSFGMDEPFNYGIQSVITPSTNTSTNQRNTIEDNFGFPYIDTMVQKLSPGQQESGMDYNECLQSLVFDFYHNQISTHVTNPTSQWSQDQVPKSVNNEENEGQMLEE